MKPNIHSRVEDRQSKQKKTHNSSARSRKFAVGDKVYV